jgi:trimethylamine--corrinoid protein Co-methyltransferase
MYTYTNSHLLLTAIFWPFSAICRKLPDYQAAYEKALAIALAAQSGCNNVSESSGMLGSLMALSLESLVIDNDLLGAVLRTVRGIEVNEETLSYDVIEQVVHGEGHYLTDNEVTAGLRRY